MCNTFRKFDSSLRMGGVAAKLVAVTAVVAALAAGVSSAQAAPTQPARKIQAVDRLEPLVLAELNKVRRAHSLRPLKLSTTLSRAADLQSRSMGRLGFFAHESSDGSPFWKRVQRFYPQGAFRNWSVGENLLWASPTLDAKRALALWMASPKHRQNILAPVWREIGIGAISVAAAPGVFGGSDVTIIATDFGSRA